MYMLTIPSLQHFDDEFWRLKINCTGFCISLFLQAKLGSAKGGPYLGVHLRRKDFIWGHREDVPSLKGAVKKIRSLMKKHKLDKVFVATDADEEGNVSLCLQYVENVFSF